MAIYFIALVLGCTAFQHSQLRPVHSLSTDADQHWKSSKYSTSLLRRSKIRQTTNTYREIMTVISIVDGCYFFLTFFFFYMFLKHIEISVFSTILSPIFLWVLMEELGQHVEFVTLTGLFYSVIFRVIKTCILVKGWKSGRTRKESYNCLC